MSLSSFTWSLFLNIEETVILRRVFCVPDSNSAASTIISKKMSSVVAIDAIDNDDLTERVLNLINVDD